MKPRIKPISIEPRLNRKDMEIILNRKRQTIWRMIKSGELPAPDYINNQMSWRESVVQNYLDNLPRQGRVA